MQHYTLHPPFNKNCVLSIFLELGSFFRSASGITFTVGMRADTGQLAALNNQVFIADGSAFEVALQDLASTGRIACLRRQAGAEMCGVMP